MNRNIKLALAATCGALLAAVTPVSAAVPCPAQYGAAAPYGGECPPVGVIQINKEVFDPTEKTKGKEWKDNIPASIHKFSVGDEVRFRLRIKNIGDKTLDKVTVTDTLPSFLETVSGEFSFEIKDLKVEQVVERELKARVVSADLCDFNVAKAVAGDKSDEDKAQVCAGRKPLKELPKAGPEDFLPTIFALLVAGFAGIKLFALRPVKEVK